MASIVQGSNVNTSSNSLCDVDTDEGGKKKEFNTHRVAKVAGSSTTINDGSHSTDTQKNRNIEENVTGHTQSVRNNAPIDDTKVDDTKVDDAEVDDAKANGFFKNLVNSLIKNALKVVGFIFLLGLGVGLFFVPVVGMALGMIAAMTILGVLVVWLMDMDCLEDENSPTNNTPNASK